MHMIYILWLINFFFKIIIQLYHVKSTTIQDGLEKPEKKNSE